MDVTETFEPGTRAAFRAWLAANHDTKKEIWLVYPPDRAPGRITYLDAVEEALSFGWIDGIAKKLDPARTAQRFTPRRPRSNWTELNKERARRLLATGRMTEAGKKVLPDLDAPFVVPPDIEAALRADPGTWASFCAFPELYRRVRVGYVAEMRRQPAELAKRLANLIAKTRKNEMFGNWDDSGMPRTP